MSVDKTIKMIFLAMIFCGFFGLAESSWAATYYVNQQSGSNDNDGAAPDSAWATISRANSALRAGDTVIISSGTYEEAIQPVNSGSAQARITYAAKNGETPTIRQVYLINKQYIRVIGFEITHNSTSFNHGVVLNGSTYVEILNNKIHHVYGQGMRNSTGGAATNYLTVRGNQFEYTGCPAGVAGGCVGANGINIIGNHNLFEYNDMAHTLDFIDLDGGYNVIRNNYFHDFANSDFPNGPGDAAHVDIWQPYDYGGNQFLRNIFENNWAMNNLESNSHFNQVRDEDSSGERDAVVRGNVALRMGSYFQQWGGFDYARVYNNTFADGSYVYADAQKSSSAVGFTNENSGADVGSNNHVFNNIFFKSARSTSTDIVYVAPGSSASVSNNACEFGGDAGCSVTAGINFANYEDNNLHLQSNSSALNAGKEIAAVISESGSGSTFTVADAGFFVASLGVNDATGSEIADWIKVGSNMPAKIAAIDYAANSITVDSPIYWNTGDPIVLAYQDSVPDIGAYEYLDDYSFSISMNHLAIVSPGTVRLEASVVNPGNVRYVEFYVDGIPVGSDAAPPYGLDWNPPQPDRTYGITAKAYSFFAGTKLSDATTVQYSYASSDGSAPAAPSGLSVQ